MSLSAQEKKSLKLKAALIKPVVSIGNKGLTAQVHNEIEVALIAHALVKIRFYIKDRDYQKATADEICQQHQAELIQSIGHVIVIYRPQQED